MKAYRAHRLAGPQSLALEEAEVPEPGFGELVVAVEAAGLHLADLAAVSGERLPRPGLPFTPGLEVAGKIAAVGDGTVGFEPGQSVVAFVPWGGLAERVIARAETCVALPDRLTPLQAAALPVAYAGALLALAGKAGPGVNVLVLGAGAQAGLAAVWVAKALGARVIGVSTGEDRLAHAREHGADDVIDAGLAALASAVGELTDEKGVEFVFDPVGGDASAAALDALASGGCLISAGFASGKPPVVDVVQLFSRGGRLLTANTPFEVARDGAAARMAHDCVVAWAASGTLEPRVAAQFAFADLRHAFDYVASRKGSGAVIVRIGD